MSFWQLSGRLLRGLRVLRRVRGRRLRHGAPAGVPGSAGLVVCLRQQNQRAVQRLRLAAHGEIPLVDKSGRFRGLCDVASLSVSGFHEMRHGVHHLLHRLHYCSVKICRQFLQGRRGDVTL